MRLLWLPELDGTVNPTSQGYTRHLTHTNDIHGLYIFFERSPMHQANVRVAVLMSPAQKRRLARKAKAANLTMGEWLRERGERFSPAEDEAALDQFAKQVTRATQRAIQSIDRTLVLVAQSEARIQALTKSHRRH